ncbi:MAG: hypothetical protein GVY33_08355 [Alphaproteobacteria bacterium]|jgi:uncharacterized cupredoxin-like copper-binding protein|nr:hypothetical protein [Alphaproteobacteria bacterium]
MTHGRPPRTGAARGFAVVALALALVAATSARAHGPEIGAPGEPAAVDRTVEIVMRDTRYEPARLTVTAGETVRFEVVNRGELVHEFNIAAPAMHAEHQAEMQALMRDGHLTATGLDAHGEHDHPNSLLLAPGAGGELIWTFPDHADVELEFACNVPGHYEAGMVGAVHLRGS